MRSYIIPSSTQSFASTLAFPMLVRDKPQEGNSLILERYFNDIYTMFLNKLTHFAMDSSHTTADAIKLRSLFDEIIKVKSLLAETEADEKGQSEQL